MCVTTDCRSDKVLKDKDISFKVCDYKELQSASAIALQYGVGGSYLWDLADVTTTSAGCWLSHALATQINKTCNVSSTIYPLDEQTLYTMKVLLQSQPPTSSSSSSFGRQDVVKSNFNFILVTAQTHGFQKQSCSAEKACVQALLSPSAFPCTSFSLPGAVIHQATVLEGGSKQPRQVSLELVGGRSCYHAPNPRPFC